MLALLALLVGLAAERSGADATLAASSIELGREGPEASLTETAFEGALSVGASPSPTLDRGMTAAASLLGGLGFRPCTRAWHVKTLATDQDPWWSKQKVANSASAEPVWQMLNT